MEDEQMFVFVVYQMREESCELDEKTRMYLRQHSFVCKRAAMQKIDRGKGEIFKRTPIEFDPLENQQCYAVVAFFDKESKEDKCLFMNQPKIAGVFLNEDKAKNECSYIFNGGHKDLREKKEKFIHCEIYPVLITPS